MGETPKSEIVYIERDGTKSNEMKWEIETLAGIDQLTTKAEKRRNKIGN